MVAAYTSKAAASPPHSIWHAACHPGTLPAIAQKTGGGELPRCRLQWKRLGGWSAAFPLQFKISRCDARTDFTSLDSGHGRPEAKAPRTQALSVCADAGAAVSLQPGVRRLRQDSVSAAYPQEGTDAGRVLQGCG